MRNSLTNHPIHAVLGMTEVVSASPGDSGGGHSDELKADQKKRRLNADIAATFLLT